MNYPYTLTDRTCSVLIDGDVYQADRSHPAWDEIKEALGAGDAGAADLIALMKPITFVAPAVNSVEHDDISVHDGAVWHGDEQIHSALGARLLDVLREGLDVDPWIAFTSNVYANPMPEARDELYEWLEASDLPITDDGCFIAYKIVADDYLDCYSRSIVNTVGTVVEMPGGRRAVDPNRRNLCSHGLHFCSRGYLPEYGIGEGRRVLLLKVNPMDVVAIPTDSGLAKGRTWRYEVVGELDDALTRQWTSVYADDSDWDAVEDPEDGFDGYDPDAGDGDFHSGPTVTTTRFGVVDRDWFANELRLAGGNLAQMARQLKVPPGTVWTWKQKLG